jgi:hypothetical protein
MKPSIYSFFILVFFSFWGNAQTDQKVFLITLDGYRWQELFSGADSLLIQNRDYVDNPEALYREFWRPSAAERREALNPFIWNKVAQMGQIHGNRTLGSKVNLTNYMWFSYPGYNEILTGRADDERISSNAKQPNPNITVLEQFAQETSKTNKVAAFGSWDVFDFIVNEQRSGVYTNSGFDLSTDYPLSSDEQLLNELQPVIPSPWGSVRLDGFTHQYAKAYLKKHHPDLIYISYGETDDFAHDGDYAAYLKSAHNTDKLHRRFVGFRSERPVLQRRHHLYHHYRSRSRNRSARYLERSRHSDKGRRSDLVNSFRQASGPSWRNRRRCTVVHQPGGSYSASIIRLASACRQRVR